MTPPTRTLLVTFAVAIASSTPLFADSSRPVGTWTREAKPLTMTVTFTNTRMSAKATLVVDGGRDTITLDAEYSVTSDGVLYGVITGVDADTLTVAGPLQAIAGQPFAARCQVDNGVLLLREVKFLGTGVRGGEKHSYDELVVAMAGRYEATSPATTTAAGHRGNRATPAVVVAPPTLGSARPAAIPESAVPSYLVSQWEKDTGGRLGVVDPPREVSPAPRVAGHR